MIKKLYSLFAFLSLVVVLAGGGLGGYLFATGKLTPERIDQMAAIVRGETESTDGVTDDTQVVKPDQGELGDVAQGPSAEELRRRQREDQIIRAMGERAYRDRQSQRQLLDQAMQHLLTTQEQFERDKKRWQDEQDLRRAETRDEGFEKELKVVMKLSPTLAKEHLILKWKESQSDAVRLMNALPDSTIKRILGQMKSPEEIQITHELLEQLGKTESK